jgi:hypothetical protein
MSKKSKKQQKEKRLQKKRARKLANRALYDSRRDAGQNTKSKRARASKKKHKLAKTVDHPEGKCGNIGCMKCNSYLLANSRDLSKIPITKAISW